MRAPGDVRGAAGGGSTIFHPIPRKLPVTSTLTISLDDDVKNRLDLLAQSTQRSQSLLAAEAVRAYVENDAWQVGEIRAALDEADAGQFATDADVEVLKTKWTPHAG